METRAVELLRRLVSIPSLSGREQEASRFLAEWLERQGARAFVDEAGSAVGQFGSGPREILLLGHIDTFPGHIPVRIEGNILHGRGSVDAKGPLCAFAAAAGEVEIPDRWKITVVGAVEEECATSKGARHIVAQRKKAGATPFCCLIGEPSHWDRLTLGYKGRLLAEINLCAPLAHSGGPEMLPAEKGVELWRLISDGCRARNEQNGASSPFECLSPSLRSIRSRDDDCYGHVTLSLGFRLPAWESPEELRSDLADWLRDWKPVFPADRMEAESRTEGSPEPKLEIFLSGDEVCWKGNKSNPLVQSFLAAIRQSGGQPRFVLKTGTSDLNVLGPAFPQMPIAAYGPGDSSLDHTPDECLDLSEYQRSIEILKEVLKKLMLSSAV